MRRPVPGLEIRPSYEELSELAAELVLECLRAAPRGLCCFAAGDTPRLAYRRLVARVREEGLDLSGLRLVGLDEWVGLGPESPGGCRHFLEEELIGPLGIVEERLAFFDGRAPDLEAECRRIDAWIEAEGPLELALLGLGPNGHLGFNEPGSPADSRSRPVALEELTRRVGAKYFGPGEPGSAAPGRPGTAGSPDEGTLVPPASEPAAPALGLTIGLGQLMGARRLILLASGAAKAGIAGRAFSADAFPEVPASLLLRHPRAALLLDEAAAADLS